MAGQDRTLFRDPLHVEHWVATSAKTPVDSGISTSSLQIERSVSDQGLAAFFSPGMQAPPLELSALSCDADLYPTNMSPVVPSNQVFLSGNSIIGEDGSSNGIASPTEISYAASIHALTFTEEYPSNGEAIYTSEAPPQLAWSPSSLATEPSYVNCYSAPGSLPCLVNSPPVVAVSEDCNSSLLGIDDYLHGSTGNPCVQYPVDVFQPDLIYPDLGTSENHSINISHSHDTGISRSLTEYSYTTITDPALWLSYAQSGTDTCGPHRAIQPLTNANARGHSFYHIGPSPIDNLYHCPFVDCGHKPDKLKCNYE
ncbi:MAG: hypothetical protein GOMPHAMPRED_002596 [Gomphillus americanus]|uniref:Uncharacterized protein n=1 Tax=Gomphillus americanus TaxID=1940652 RepID=A0A8H3FIG0_9LECA|nr:MAG: hypothetical protein GOMPHAMPRED_002596 [Gomphillus americanus]